ncbi:DUF11 domain-containing protein [Ruania halotolerans]|uniref:DUF11 domain-containing protein n=1 Tax=Ruania halotolerans TaxID=2897773 RepID=UPI001E4868C2|nr:DUF11 domain-containing protein [Ruania halotolerans]UFU07359.1 DUF11 domain-containing protein [Ruania halotolerans]
MNTPVPLRRNAFRTVMAFVTAALVAMTTLVVASPAMAAPVYEITARWAQDTPDTVASGDVVTAEWRVNVNDDAAAPSNEPVDNVNFTLTLENGTFASLPDSCVMGGTPESSISDDGQTLVCNIGTQDQGSAHVVQTAVLVDGETGSQVSASGTIDGLTADLAPIEIENTFGLDMDWGTPTGDFGFGDTYVDVDYQWTLFLAKGSEAGPDSVSYTVDVTADNGSAVSLTPGAECTPFTEYAAPGHPWSGGDQPAENTAPFVGSCTLTPTGTPGRFTLTLTGIDYSLTDVPTRDSANAPLPVDRSAVASGSVSFRFDTTTNTGTNLSTNAPTYTAPGSGATVVDDAANNTANKAITFPGGVSASWNRDYTNAGGGPWDDSYRVSRGTQVQQHMSHDTRGFADSDPDSLFGLCQVLDTRYVDYAQVQVGGGIDLGTYPVQYYVGPSPLLDPDSASYDPNQFGCDTGGTTVDGGGGWVTTAPADLSTVGAVRIVYPQTVTQEHPAREALRVMSTIQDDVPVGQDIWMWGLQLQNDNWRVPGAGSSVTATPDARYPATHVTRDILRVVSATPAVEKSVDRSVVTPGAPATYTLTYSANGAGGVPPAIDGYELVDTLPAGMTYVPGSATPEPTLSTAGGRQVLTWGLDDVPTNTEQALTYQAVADDSVEPGEVLTNEVEAAYDGHTASDSAQVTVSTSGFTTIGKSADAAFIPNLDGDGVGEGSWTVTLRSFDPLPQEYTDTIDILPFNGDERGTEFSGSYGLTGVDAVAGATVYYTTADPDSLSDDPADGSNGSAGSVAGNTVGWSTTFTADATAVRVIGPELVPGGTQQFTVNVATDGVLGGDVLVNRAQARDGHTELVMRTSAPITIANYYSASLKKYVQDAEGEWRDANTVEDYPSFFVGDTIRYRIVVENTGQGTLTGVTVTDDQQPDLGGFVIDELAPGDTETHEFEIIADASTGDGVVNTACATADIPADSEVPPTINCDPAGVEVEGDPTHTKSLVSASPIGGGQWEIVYALEVSNASTASTSYSLVDELHFTDQVSIASAEVTDAPEGVTLADPAWDGQGNLAVATGVPLLGNDDDGYASHIYELTVVADVPLQFDPVADTQCLGGDTDSGFNNVSELTKSDGEVEIDEACGPPPSVDVSKSIADGPTPNGDGTWTVLYEVVATNAGAGEGDYDISDQMSASGDLEVITSSITSAPEGVTPSDAWTGLGR